MLYDVSSLSIKFGNFATISNTFAAVICDEGESCSVNTVYISRVVIHNVTSEHDSTFTLLVILKWHMSINVAKWTFFLSLLYFQNNFLLALNFIQLPCWLPFLVHCCFRVWDFHRFWHWDELVCQIVVCHRMFSFACDAIFMIFR